MGSDYGPAFDITKIVVGIDLTKPGFRCFKIWRHQSVGVGDIFQGLTMSDFSKFSAFNTSKKAWTPIADQEYITNFVRFQNHYKRFGEESIVARIDNSPVRISLIASLA